MKKISVTILVYLFAATTAGYAQFFRDRDTNNDRTTENAYGSSRSENNSAGFFRSSEADGPGDRPGSGGGIGQGQDAPLKEGLHVLLGCCLIFGVVKVVNGNRKKQDKK